MKPILFVWFFLLAARPVLAQAITSRVYAMHQASVAEQASSSDRTLLNGTTRDFASLSVHAITVPANQPAQADQQLEEELLIIVQEGELTLQLGSRKKNLGPGSVAVIMPGDAFRLENKASMPLTYYILRLTSNEVPDLDVYRLMGESFWVDGKEVPFEAHDKGGVRHVFDCGTAMTKRFELHISTLNPGMQSHPAHTHRAAEILLPIDGKAQESIDGTWHDASTGDVIFLESNVPHAIRNNGQKPCTYFAFQFE